METITILISGKVQGVGFRYFVKKNANMMNIKGFVKNTYDKKVKVVAEGKKNIMEVFINSCKIGPSSAIVENIEYQNIPFVDYKVFQIKY